MLLGVKVCEQGRRTIDIRPSGVGVEAVRQAADTVDDPGAKTIIRRAVGALSSIS